jgi:hypothetical protein
MSVWKDISIIMVKKFCAVIALTGHPVRANNRLQPQRIFVDISFEKCKRIIKLLE